MSSSTNQLRRFGLTNFESQDLASYVSPASSVSIAFCNSFRCTPKKGYFNANGIKKKVPFSSVDCPDCGHALKWKTVAKEVV